MHDNSKIVVGEENYQSRLYMFSNFIARFDYSLLLTYVDDDSRLWHQRFGNLNFKYMQQQCKQGIVTDLLDIHFSKGVYQGCRIYYVTFYSFYLIFHSFSQARIFSLYLFQDLYDFLVSQVQCETFTWYQSKDVVRRKQICILFSCSRRRCSKKDWISHRKFFSCHITILCGS